MKAHCINIKQRTQKWLAVKIECEKLDIEPIRFEAIFKPPGHEGCMLSHAAVLKSMDDDIFMVIEDDIEVLGTRDDLDKAIEQLPDDWDMLYLGASLHAPIERFSDNLFRLKNAKSTHAVIYNNQNGVVDYIIKNCYAPIDVFLAEDVQEKFKCFITYPLICTQAEGFSDTVRWFTNYEFIVTNYNKYTNT